MLVTFKNQTIEFDESRVSEWAEVQVELAVKKLNTINKQAKVASMILKNKKTVIEFLKKSDSELLALAGKKPSVDYDRKGMSFLKSPFILNSF